MGYILLANIKNLSLCGLMNLSVSKGLARVHRG